VLRSLRWKLFAWYALLLAILVAAFGLTLYYNLRRALQAEVDGRLRAHAQAVAGALEGGPGSFELKVPEEVARLFAGRDEETPYFIVWDPEGRIVGRSRPGLEVPRPPRPARRDRGSRREVTVAGREGTLVLAGQKISEEREELGELLAAVVGAGAAVMGFALAGGWLLVWRALRPIRRISEAAAEVSASNLSRRVDASKMERELAGLAETLNATFARLEQAFERQTRFTADASHELRTPLSIVLSEAELALRKERTGPEYRESLETVRRASQRMKAVVEGLLTLARADARELNLNRERLDLRKIVEETAALTAPLALERKVTVTVAADPVEVEGDRDRLREIVTNLLTNAIRYNVLGGKVDVSLQERGDRAVLSVADTGIGIPEKDRPHVFERFYRVDPARSREQGGTGLGLAITKWAVEAHGGTISLESRDGAGTTFTVSLPLGR
jgi:heavy metal sensor kinase